MASGVINYGHGHPYVGTEPPMSEGKHGIAHCWNHLTGGACTAVLCGNAGWYDGRQRIPVYLNKQDSHDKRYVCSVACQQQVNEEQQVDEPAPVCGECNWTNRHCGSPDEVDTGDAGAQNALRTQGTEVGARQD